MEIQTCTIVEDKTPDPLYTLQITLERLYSKNQLHRRIAKEFTESTLGFAECLTENNMPLSFGFDVLVQLALHKRADVPKMIGLVRKHFSTLQETADMLMKLAEMDLIDFDINRREFVVIYGISEDVQEELDRYQFPLPMVVPPQPIRDNMDTGYILGRGSVILRNNHHDDDVNLDHLNRVNKIPFTINFDTATMVKNQWRNLDKRKEGESSHEFEARKRAFEKYDRVAHDVMEKLVEHGNRHFMTHKYDKRGRTYCQGYHVSYQGTAWNKAVIELADKEMVDG